MFPEMDFSAALLRLKAGDPIARAYWNDERRLKLVPQPGGGIIHECRWYNNISHWRPLHGDLMADDWFVPEGPMTHRGRK